MKSNLNKFFMFIFKMEIHREFERTLTMSALTFDFTKWSNSNIMFDVNNGPDFHES